MRSKRKKVYVAPVEYDFYWMSSEGIMAAKSNGEIVNLSKRVQ